MFSKFREVVDTVKAVAQYEPVTVAVFDLDDAPLDNPLSEGDNTTLAGTQPAAVRPSDIGENE